VDSRSNPYRARCAPFVPARASRPISRAGWKTRGVFERYNIITQTDIKDAMAKLQDSEKAANEREGSDCSHVLSHVHGNQKPSAVN